jgi:uncharacterized protein (DUF4415 family)
MKKTKKITIVLPEPKKPKVTVAIRMDEEVKRWFQRRGYTALMSHVLKAYMESQK